MNCIDFYMLKMFLFEIVSLGLPDHAQGFKISVFDCFDFLDAGKPVRALN